MGHKPMVSINRAEKVIDTIAVDISVLGTGSIAPATGEDFPVLTSLQITVSIIFSDVMECTDVAHHVCGSGVSGVIPEVGVSGDSTLAPVGTVIG